VSAAPIGRKTWLITAVVVGTNAGGNLFLKWGVGSGASWLETLLNPWLYLGVALLMLWTLSRMALLSRADLSWVLPVTASGYVLTVLLGVMFLGERVSGRRWAAVLLIVAGTALVARTRPMERRA